MDINGTKFVLCHRNIYKMLHDLEPSAEDSIMLSDFSRDQQKTESYHSSESFIDNDIRLGEIVAETSKFTAVRQALIEARGGWERLPEC